MERGKIMRMTQLVENKNGAVMVMVLLVLVAAIILGVSVMRSTTIDAKIAGNERIYQQDFYASEAAGEFTILQFDNIVSSREMILDDPEDVSGLVNDINTIQDVDAAVLTFKRTGTLPVGSGTSAANMAAYYYVISTTINGKTIHKGVWKAFPTSE